MNYKVQHITNKAKLINKINSKKYLTIHSTGNLDSTAQNERDNLNRVGNTSSTGFHIVVDDKQAIECIPLNKVAYHAGDGGDGKGNNQSIGLEICESGNRNITLHNAVQAAVKILKEENIPIENMKRHFDWSGKNCPRILSKNNWKGWNEFVNEVKKELNKSNVIEKVEDKVSPWAVDAIKWAKENNLTDGTNVKENITLERFITILHRYHLQNK